MFARICHRCPRKIDYTEMLLCSFCEIRRQEDETARITALEGQVKMLLEEREQLKELKGGLESVMRTVPAIFEKMDVLNKQSLEILHELQTLDDSDGEEFAIEAEGSI